MDDTSSSSSGSWQLDSQLGAMDEQDQITSLSSFSSLYSSLRPPAKSCSWSDDQSAGMKDGVDIRVGAKEPTSEGQEVVLSFGISEFEVELEGHEPKVVAGGASKRTRCPVNAQDHVLAERRRRRKMAQMFLDLGCLIPGLNKIDEVSIVEEAIKYIKQLEEQIKLLEQPIEDNPKSDRNYLGSDDDDDDDDDNDEISSKNDDNPGLNVKAKVSGEEILIGVFCKNDYDLVPKIFDEISKLHLTPLNSNFITFADYYLDITIVAQMEGEFCMTMENLVKYLRQALE